MKGAQQYQDFLIKAKNTNTYRILKPIDGELSYAEFGDKFKSDILYERGYNMDQLVKDGYIELIPRIFPFENDAVNIMAHSILTICPECGSKGVNLPLEKDCGNCGYTETITYYDAETVDALLRNAKSA